MPLNLSVSDGDFTPYIKYNAKAGRWYVKPEGATEEVEVVNPALAFDMANIKTGWIYYPEGGGAPPEKVWDPTLSQQAPKPPGMKKFRRGFEVMVVGADNVPGVGVLGLREFGSTAGVVIGSILKMYDLYEIGAKENADKVPVFRCAQVAPVDSKYGTNYEPVFSLLGWAERKKVPELDAHLASSDNVTERTTAPLNGNGHAPPPRDNLDDSIPFN
jgi:hypothetical protein